MSLPLVEVVKHVGAGGKRVVPDRPAGAEQLVKDTETQERLSPRLLTQRAGTSRGGCSRRRPGGRSCPFLRVLRRAPSADVRVASASRARRNPSSSLRPTNAGDAMAHLQAGPPDASKLPEPSRTRAFTRGGPADRPPSVASTTPAGRKQPWTPLNPGLVAAKVLEPARGNGHGRHWSRPGRSGPVYVRSASQRLRSSRERRSETESLTAPDVVDVTQGAQSVHFTITAADRGGPGPASGLKAVWVAFGQGGFDEPGAEIHRLTEQADGTWAGDVVVEAGSQSGVTPIVAVGLRDKAGNSAPSAGPTAGGRPTERQSVISTPDQTRPTADLLHRRVRSRWTREPTHRR